VAFEMGRQLTEAAGASRESTSAGYRSPILRSRAAATVLPNGDAAEAGRAIRTDFRPIVGSQQR
jgi:hypothetical protein